MPSKAHIGKMNDRFLCLIVCKAHVFQRAPLGAFHILPTISMYPTWLFIGSVFIWHMYHPLSDSRTSLMWRNHVRRSLCVTPIRWFFVMTWLAMVRMVCVSTRSHATWREQYIKWFPGSWIKTDRINFSTVSYINLDLYLEPCNVSMPSFTVILFSWQCSCLRNRSYNLYRFFEHETWISHSTGIHPRFFLIILLTRKPSKKVRIM